MESPSQKIFCMFSFEMVHFWPKLLKPLSSVSDFDSWLGHQTCKNRRPYNLYCVGADVKPCSINQSTVSFQIILQVNGQLGQLIVTTVLQ